MIAFISITPVSTKGSWISVIHLSTLFRFLAIVVVSHVEWFLSCNQGTPQRCLCSCSQHGLCRITGEKWSHHIHNSRSTILISSNCKTSALIYNHSEAKLLLISVYSLRVSCFNLNNASNTMHRRGAVVKGVADISTNLLVNIWVARVRVLLVPSVGIWICKNSDINT